MPLVTTDDVLQLAVDAAAATQELSNLALFAPAAIAAGILLEIFKTIQKIQTNKADCHRLANRCLSMLRRVHDQMTGRWEDSPPSLLKALKAFEATLDSIQVFLISEASKSWHARLRRKRSIEKALHSFSVRLDDAERSFQIATLINIHYAVGDKVTQASSQKQAGGHSALDSFRSSASEESLRERASAQEENSSTDRSYTERKEHTRKSIPVMIKHDMVQEHLDPDPLLASEVSLAPGTLSNIPSASNDDTEVILLHESPRAGINSPGIHTRPPLRQTLTDGDGFRRYHQSDLLLRGLSRSREGWWVGTAQAEVDGVNVMVKRYEGSRDGALERWKNDVEILRRYRDLEMARMLGYSQDSCTTPFIVLASGSLRLPDGLSYTAT